MNTNALSIRAGRPAFYLLALVWAALGLASAQAQLAPVLVAATQAVLDETGQPLSNAEGDLVQFLQVNGQVHPPALNGAPHPSNTVVFVSRIGRGVSVSPAQAGKFSAALTPPPAGALIARAFNAPTLEGASFYADSAPFTPNGPAVLQAAFTATTNALDPADDDGDGVNNSWEKSLGANRNHPDSDGDGMSDGDEFRAGTGLTDADSALLMVRVIPQAGGALRADWESVPGKSYQLQYRAGNLDDPSGAFSNVSEVASATGDVTSVVMTNGASFPMGIFRVVLSE